MPEILTREQAAVNYPQVNLQAFHSWLVTQRSEGRYDYLDCTNCLCAQFLRSLGIRFSSVGGNYWRPAEDPLTQISFPKGFDTIAGEAEWSYSAARDRAAKALRG